MGCMRADIPTKLTSKMTCQLDYQSTDAHKAALFDQN